MPTNHYPVRTGSSGTALGRELLDVSETINVAFARLKLLRDKWVQAKDGSAGNATDHVTPASLFGTVDASNVISSTTAAALFAELDSFVGNAGASLTQYCARVKQ